MFMCGYNLGDGNWIWGKTIDPKKAGQLEDCLSQIKKWIKEGTLHPNL
jgi:GH24 family phage-related lysozyme (muramidase)